MRRDLRSAPPAKRSPTAGYFQDSLSEVMIHTADDPCSRAYDGAGGCFVAVRCTDVEFENSQLPKIVAFNKKGPNR